MLCGVGFGTGPSRKFTFFVPSENEKVKFVLHPGNGIVKQVSSNFPQIYCADWVCVELKGTVYKAIRSLIMNIVGVVVLNNATGQVCANTCQSDHAHDNHDRSQDQIRD